STRVNDPRTTAMVVVMQRCHQQDLSGHLLEQGGWEHLCLPAEYEGWRPATAIGFADPRHNPGELLWPERFGAQEIESLKRSLGSYAAAGQLQQRPSPAGGGLLKRHWFRYWQPAGANLPPGMGRLPDRALQSVIPVGLARLDEVIQSWDCAFKDLEKSDYVVGQVWGRAGSAYFLLDQIRAHLDCPATIKAVVRLSEQWPMGLAKLIEDKANGSAVIQMLARDIPGILPVTPEGGKVARAAAVSPLIEAGNIHLPHPQFAPWVDDFVEECAAFPHGAHDDQVDAMTQALLRWNMAQEVPSILIYDEPYVISASGW